MNRSEKTRGRRGAVCGAILLAGGGVFLGSKMGWIPDELIRSIPFIPIAMIAVGALLLASAFTKRHGNGPSAGEPECGRWPGPACMRKQK